MELVNITYVGPDQSAQKYSDADLNLINSNLIIAPFGQPGDYIEYYIYDLNNDIVGLNYNLTDYKIAADQNVANGQTTALFLDPEKQAKDLGFNRGSVVVKYNFYRPLLRSTPALQFWIKEISTTRTEIKVARQDLSNADLSDAFDVFNAAATSNAYYPDFYLNFGLDITALAVNAVYVEEDGVGYIIFKLYEPLPQEYDVKSQFWVVQQVAQSERFQVDVEVEADPLVDQFKLRGPNYDVDLMQKVGQTTPYYNYNTLFSTTVTSSLQQIQSLFDEKAARINVDYSDFANFIHFSSATERVNNFVYKLSLIESYQSSSAALAGLIPGPSTTTIVNNTITTLQQNIDNIIKKFDPYEYYLYYTSASTAWPKSGSVQPYSLYSVTSSQALAWLGGADTLPTPSGLSILYSASFYDNTNSNGLRYTAPAYIQEDSLNEPYLVFLDMIGQHFDNIWLYYKDVTNRFSGDNNPDLGISLDLVTDALRGLGIELYTNTNISDNIYYSLFGINNNGSVLPPTGSELITNYVTSSIQTLPALTIEQEVYKRLYHNLPYLLKTKGTERGVKALIACYGIPNSILTVNEFGGYNIYSQGDILGIQDNKIYTGSVQELSASLLSPYTTLQEYVNNTERNSINVEIGFSPADSINADITASLPLLSVQQLIGNPALQYSSSYTPLANQSNTYFAANYTSRYNVWDFIRLIKFYNNSLFKMLKDFVPARASLSSGIIIKSHILERNKYARTEPVASTSSYEDSIDMISITGSDGLGLNYPTNYTSTVETLSGSVAINNNYYFERYTGQFSGSTLDIVDGNLPQYEQSYQPHQSCRRYTIQWVAGAGDLYYDYTDCSGNAVSVGPISSGTQTFSALAGSINVLAGNYILTDIGAGLGAVPPLQIPLNYLYQNVSGSPKSTRFLDLDYSSNQNIPVNYGLITKSINDGQASLLDPYAPYAQLQDYNYYLKRSIIPRYDGSRMSGQRYNSYTLGDITYGKNPVINHNTNKVGLFTQVETSSFIPGAVNATLGYLADISGGLFELNQENRSWQDVQNIFKAGTSLTVKQFDNQKYSNQKATDGTKTIYNSGYSYSPQLYFTSGGDTRLYFNYVGVSSSADFFASNTGTPNFFISGSPNPTYGVSLTTPATRQGNIYNIFDQANPAVNYGFGSISSNTFPSYSAQIAGVKTFTVNLDVNFQFPDPSIPGNVSTYAQYSFAVLKNNTTVIASQTASFQSIYNASGRTTGSIVVGSNQYINSYTSIVTGGTATGPFLITPAGGGSPIFVGGPSSQITYVLAFVNPQSNASGAPFLVVTNRTADLVGYISAQAPGTGGGTVSFLQGTPVSSVALPPILQFAGTRTISFTTPPEAFDPGDTAVFRFMQDVVTQPNFTSSINVGSLTVTDAAGIGNYPYATSSLENFIVDIKSPGVFGYDEIILNDSVTQYVDYQFIPYFESGSRPTTSSLYYQYGDIQFPFAPEANDKIILRDNSGRTQNLDIVSTRTFISGSSSNTYLGLSVIPPILANWVQNPKLITRFLLLKRFKDEQNVILTFPKKPGLTSYGFIIPDNIAEEVLSNMNTLQAAVQTQLLSNQSIPAIDLINGGSFGN